MAALPALIQSQQLAAAAAQLAVFLLDFPVGLVAGVANLGLQPLRVGQERLVKETQVVQMGALLAHHTRAAAAAVQVLLAVMQHPILLLARGVQEQVHPLLDRQ
jgi:hypothetical protein